MASPERLPGRVYLLGLGLASLRHRTWCGVRPAECSLPAVVSFLKAQEKQSGDSALIPSSSYPKLETPNLLPK